MKSRRSSFYIIGLFLLSSFLVAACSDSSQGLSSSAGTDGTVANQTVATEEVLRTIPDSILTAARSYTVAYWHTSHGTHVSYGVYGLPNFKTGDNTRFAVKTARGGAASTLTMLDVPSGTAYDDLSTADANWSTWITNMRDYLDTDTNEDVDIIMWSWCNIAGHSVPNYLSSAQTIIDEYGAGGSKIGDTRTNPITFIFMTGHANANSNTGGTNPKPQAEAILAYCQTRGYYCIDYWGIDSHDMDGNYWEDVGDNGDSDAYEDAYYSAHPGIPFVDRSFYNDWQLAHTVGTDWYYSKDSPGGTNTVGNHNATPENYITANRKAFAFWWVLARIAGWDGV